MRRVKKSFFSMIARPLLVFMVVLSAFTIVWIRSTVVSLEYSINSLEKKKMQALRESKMLAAEKANLLSIEKLEKVASNSFVIPDRVKVVQVKQAGMKEPQKVALSVEEGVFSPRRMIKKIMD
ncbi:MAG: hypothetical protein EPN22_10565 [Nitrospirae bacterium]|nr:MAG: hypothetical protein EPN22_10565 [Nitrospirota bacterium]